MQGFGQRFGEGNIRDICAEATNAGINFYDTAEVYGYQNNDKKDSSEYIVGRSAARAGAPAAANRPESDAWACLLGLSA